VILLLGLIGGTILIANLNVPLASPAARLRRIFGRPKVGARGRDNRIPRRMRWPLIPLIALLVLVLTATAVTVVAFGKAVFYGENGDNDLWARLTSWLPGWLGILITASVFATPLLIIAHGVIVGNLKARELRPHASMPPEKHPDEKIGRPKKRATPVDTKAPEPDETDTNSSQTASTDKATASEHGNEPVKAARYLGDPDGLATAWSAAYGCAYMALAFLIVAAVQLDPPGWAMAAAAIAVLIAVGFSVVAVWAIPLLRERRLTQKLAAALAAKGIVTAGHRVTDEDGTERDCTVEEGDFDDLAIGTFVKLGEESMYLFDDEETLSRRGRRLLSHALSGSKQLLVGVAVAPPQPTVARETQT
jgi:lysylphosphatidylglycerol synthetase-like protein (DUF2156 family)